MLATLLVGPYHKVLSSADVSLMVAPGGGGLKKGLTHPPLITVSWCLRIQPRASPRARLVLVVLVIQDVVAGVIVLSSHPLVLALGIDVLDSKRMARSAAKRMVGAAAGAKRSDPRFRPVLLMVGRDCRTAKQTWGDAGACFKGEMQQLACYLMHHPLRRLEVSPPPRPPSDPTLKRALNSPTQCDECVEHVQGPLRAIPGYKGARQQKCNLCNMHTTWCCLTCSTADCVFPVHPTQSNHRGKITHHQCWHRHLSAPCGLCRAPGASDGVESRLQRAMRARRDRTTVRRMLRMERCTTPLYHV